MLRQVISNMIPDMVRSIVREEVTILREEVTSLRAEVPILREAVTSLREKVRGTSEVTVILWEDLDSHRTFFYTSRSGSRSTSTATTSFTTTCRFWSVFTTISFSSTSSGERGRWYCPRFCRYSYYYSHCCRYSSCFSGYKYGIFLLIH